MKKVFNRIRVWRSRRNTNLLTPVFSILLAAALEFWLRSSSCTSNLLCGFTLTKHLPEISYHKIWKIWTVHFFILFPHKNTALVNNCHCEMCHPPCHIVWCQSFIFFFYSLALDVLAWHLGCNLWTKLFPSNKKHVFFPYNLIIIFLMWLANLTRRFKSDVVIRPFLRIWR